MHYFMPPLGIAVMMGIAFLMSRNRQLALANWRLVAWALGLQVIFALLILRTPFGTAVFAGLNSLFVSLTGCVDAGVNFVFGPEISSPESGSFIAFHVLPIVLFFSALSAILYHAGAVQILVKGLAWIMERTLGTSGAETLAAAANVFVGCTEAPLVIRHYLSRMTSSELLSVMSGGLATIAGSVLAAYITILSGVLPDIAGHLLAASVMSAPAALLFAKILMPETGRPETLGKINIPMRSTYRGYLDAATAGTTEGVKLALNVGAMLIVFLSLIAVVNLVLGVAEGSVNWMVAGGGEFAIGNTFTLERIAGWVFYPFAVLMGVPFDEAHDAARLLGIKTIANEFIAYLMLVQEAEAFSPRTRLVLAYALCGFANIGTIGILIGGMSVIAPERRPDLARLGPWALVAGTFACNTTACIAALIAPESSILIPGP
jgi:CNT family concentrative nucleoside transporter